MLVTRLVCAPFRGPISRNRGRTASVRVMSTKKAIPTDDDATGSFISQVCVRGSPSGPLQGLTLAVKDLYDMAGQPTGFGHPLWLETHPAADSTAPPVQALLDAGATGVGKTHMDEMAYSLNGENFHYGTPVNMAAPGRIPGGSSSGSAAAVAAGQAEVGLGSDTGGSVRVPASYCGLFGFRPTHGRISLAAARPLAPSMDTVGWFTRDAALLQQVGNVLLGHASTTVAAPGRPPAASATAPAAAPAAAARGAATTTTTTTATSSSSSTSSLAQPRWLVAKDGFGLASPETSQAVYNALAGDRFPAVSTLLGSPEEVDLGSSSSTLAAAGLNALTDWLDVFRVTQGWEIWHQHGPWIRQHGPIFGPGIKERFQMASGITEQDWAEQDSKRTLISNHVEEVLGSNGVLAIPTAPGPAVPVNTPPEQLDTWRRSLISLTCIAGLSGLPQVTLPVAKVDGLPVGLSLIGPRNSDEQLLELAAKLADIVLPVSK